MVDGGIRNHQQLAAIPRLPSDLQARLLGDLGLNPFERALVHAGLRRLH